MNKLNNKSILIAAFVVIVLVAAAFIFFTPPITYLIIAAIFAPIGFWVFLKEKRGWIKVIGLVVFGLALAALLYFSMTGLKPLA